MNTASVAYADKASLKCHVGSGRNGKKEAEMGAVERWTEP
jgi:hypothetical protein